MEAIIRTAGACVGLKINYPKGSGDLFFAFMEESHPGDTFLHVKYVKDNRKDIVCESSGTTCMGLQH